MYKEGPIRVLDVQVAISCLQPSQLSYCKRIIAEADTLTQELLEVARGNEAMESERTYFNGGHLGTIIEHEDFPATKDEVLETYAEAMDFLREV